MQSGRVLGRLKESSRHSTFSEAQFCRNSAARKVKTPSPPSPPPPEYQLESRLLAGARSKLNEIGPAFLDRYEGPDRVLRLVDVWQQVYGSSAVIPGGVGTSTAGRRQAQAILDYSLGSPNKTHELWTLFAIQPELRPRGISDEDVSLYADKNRVEWHRRQLAKRQAVRHVDEVRKFINLAEEEASIMARQGMAWCSSVRRSLQQEVERIFPERNALVLICGSVGRGEAVPGRSDLEWILLLDSPLDSIGRATLRDNFPNHSIQVEGVEVSFDDTCWPGSQDSHLHAMSGTLLSIMQKSFALTEYNYTLSCILDCDVAPELTSGSTYKQFLEARFKHVCRDLASPFSVVRKSLLESESRLAIMTSKDVQSWYRTFALCIQYLFYLNIADGGHCEYSALANTQMRISHLESISTARLLDPSLSYRAITEAWTSLLRWRISPEDSNIFALHQRELVLRLWRNIKEHALSQDMAQQRVFEPWVRCDTREEHFADETEATHPAALALVESPRVPAQPGPSRSASTNTVAKRRLVKSLAERQRQPYIRLKRREVDGVLSCPGCKAKFNARERLRRHIDRMHMDNADLVKWAHVVRPPRAHFYCIPLPTLSSGK